MATVKKLSEVLPPELQEGITRKIDEYFDIPLVIHTCRVVSGANGEYMRIVVSLPDSDEQFYISTGASQPKEILQYLKDNRKFPILGTFHQAGRAIILS